MQTYNLGKNIVKCLLCGNNFNSFSPDTIGDGAYFIMDNNGNPQIICNSEVHNKQVAGLVNPVWIDKVAIKYPGNEDFQLEFKYENKVKIFNSNQLDGNPKTIGGILSYSECIFSTFYNDIYKLVERKYNK